MMRIVNEKGESVTTIGKGFHWIDCQKITKEEGDILQKQFDLHPLTVEDLLNNSVRVKIEEFPNHLFCVFYGLSKDDQLHEVDFVLGKDFLITNHQFSLKIVEDILADTPRIIRLAKKGPEHLMHRIFDSVVDHCFEVLERNAEDTERLEEAASDNPNKRLLAQIYKTKRILARIKRVMMAQREKAGWLAKTNTDFIHKDALPYYRDVYDHCIQLNDALDGYREDIVNVFEVYMSSVSNNMNEVMKVLSIIATITLPLTVVSGIYGTNFLNLPGMHAYYGFWYMLAGMVVMSVFMIWLFKKKKWL